MFFAHDGRREMDHHQQVPVVGGVGSQQAAAAVQIDFDSVSQQHAGGDGGTSINFPASIHHHQTAPTENRSLPLDELMINSSSSAKEAKHTQRMLTWLCAVGKFNGCGPGASTALRHFLYSFLTLCAALVHPYLNVWAPSCDMYDSRHRAVGYITSIIYFSIFISFGVAMKQLHVAMLHHMPFILQGIDLGSPAAQSLRTWLKLGYWAYRIGMIMFLFQGIMFFGWFKAQWEINPGQTMLWAFCYFMYWPLAGNQVMWASIVMAVANKASVAHLKQELDRYKVAHKPLHFGSSQVLLPTDTMAQDTAVAIDHIMSTLVRVNNVIIPANMDGFATPFGIYYVGMVCFSICLLCQFLVATRSTAKSVDSAGDGSSAAGAVPEYNHLYTLVSSGISLVAAHVAALIPAQISVECTQVVGLVNEMRYRQPSDSTGHFSHELATDSDLVRLEAISRYIHEANGGHGMGFMLFGVRLSSAQLKNIIRLIVTAFTYLVAQLDSE
jgi:hypothetical protein